MEFLFPIPSGDTSVAAKRRILVIVKLQSPVYWTEFHEALVPSSGSGRFSRGPIRQGRTIRLSPRRLRTPDRKSAYPSGRAVDQGGLQHAHRRRRRVSLLGA